MKHLNQNISYSVNGRMIFSCTTVGSVSTSYSDLRSCVYISGTGSGYAWPLCFVDPLLHCQHNQRYSPPHVSEGPTLSQPLHWQHNQRPPPKTYPTLRAAQRRTLHCRHNRRSPNLHNELHRDNLSTGNITRGHIPPPHPPNFSPLTKCYTESASLLRTLSETTI